MNRKSKEFFEFKTKVEDRLKEAARAIPYGEWYDKGASEIYSKHADAGEKADETRSRNSGCDWGSQYVFNDEYFPCENAFGGNAFKWYDREYYKISLNEESGKVLGGYDEDKILEELQVNRWSDLTSVDVMVSKEPMWENQNKINFGLKYQEYQYDYYLTGSSIQYDSPYDKDGASIYSTDDYFKKNPKDKDWNTKLRHPILTNYHITDSLAFAGANWKSVLKDIPEFPNCDKNCVEKEILPLIQRENEFTYAVNEKVKVGEGLEKEAVPIKNPIGSWYATKIFFPNGFPHGFLSTKDYYVTHTPESTVGEPLAGSGKPFKKTKGANVYEDQENGKDLLEKAIGLAIKEGHIPGKTLRHIQFVDDKVYFYGAGSSSGKAGSDCFTLNENKNAYLQFINIDNDAKTYWKLEKRYYDAPKYKSDKWSGEGAVSELVFITGTEMMEKAKANRETRTNMNSLFKRVQKQCCGKHYV